MGKIKAAFNSTPLIYFSKVGRLDIILELFGVYIDKEVYREVVEEGRSKGMRDALVVESAVEQHSIKVIDLGVDLKKFAKLYKLGLGDLSTIMLVEKNIADVAIIDDSYARKVAKVLGVRVHGSLFILKYAVLKEKLSREEAIKVLHEMVLHGFRILPEIIVQFEKELASS